MAGAVLGLRAPGLVVEDPGTVAKTLPEFVDLWHGLVDPGPVTGREPTRVGLRRERRPHPPEPPGLPAEVQGPPRPRGRRPRVRHRRRPRSLHRAGREGRRWQAPDGRPWPERIVTAMKARELGRKGIVVGDDVELVGDTTGNPDGLARVVRLTPRRSVLRRTADDTDPVERVIVANADQLVIVSALANPEPRPRMIDRCLVAAYDAGLDPLLVLTKADLADADAFLANYAPLNVRSVVTATGESGFEGLEALQRAAGRPDQRLHRPLRRRQVHPRQRPGPRRPPGDRGRQRLHRSRSPHLQLRRRAAAARGRRLGDRHPGRALVRPGPRRPRPDHPALPRPRARHRRSAPAAAPTTRRSAPSTRGWPPVRRGRPAPHAWSRCAACCGRARATPTESRSPRADPAPGGRRRPMPLTAQAFRSADQTWTRSRRTTAWCPRRAAPSTTARHRRADHGQDRRRPAPAAPRRRSSGPATSSPGANGRPCPAKRIRPGRNSSRNHRRHPVRVSRAPASSPSNRPEHGR